MDLIRKEEVLEELSRNKEIVSKYNMPGIYKISIDKELVYIGCAINMLERLAEHIRDMENCPGSHKYDILHEARATGHKVSFDKIQECEADFAQIRNAEGALIRQYKPWLNTQIPNEDNYLKYTYNYSAQHATLNEILAGKIEMINWE